MLLWTFSHFLFLFLLEFLVLTREGFQTTVSLKSEENSALDSWQGLQSVTCTSWIISLIICIGQGASLTKQYLMRHSSTAGLFMSKYHWLYICLWSCFSEFHLSYCILCPIFYNFITVPGSISWQPLVTVDSLGNAYYCIQPWYKADFTCESDSLNEFPSHLALQHRVSHKRWFWDGLVLLHTEKKETKLTLGYFWTRNLKQRLKVIVV